MADEFAQPGDDKLNFRDRLQGDLGARYGKLLEVVDAALQATKKVSADVTCKHCKRSARYLVEVADTKAALDAAAFMAEHGYGRPGIAADDGENERIIFVRVIGGTDASAIWEVAQTFVPAERFEEFELAVAERQRSERDGLSPARSSDVVVDRMAELAESASRSSSEHEIRSDV